jgi:hypothetical protein
LNFILFGRVVTMDSQLTVIPNGAVYVDGDSIAAVAERGGPPPAGFAGAPSVDTGGTLYPGLIELHNHLSYDSLPMWSVPQKFTNRGQWQNNADYAAHVSGPMGVIAQSKDSHVLAAVARYAETKCLFGGVASSQGISLKGDNLDTYYRSAMRVVDDPGDAEFPRVATHIPDIDASEWGTFDKELVSLKNSTLLLHLSEGLDAEARKAFLALQHGSQWAITPALAGIHCAALEPQDFAIMKSKGASVVWSPLSNLLLYGGTTNIKAARAAGLDIALGSDWSPSGSKNLLNELKVAKIADGALGLGLTDQDIVAMVTSTAARIIKWDALVGSIAAGKRADFTVIAAPASADPYSSLINARETDMVLLMVDGRAVLGTPALMSALGQSGESIKLGAAKRIVNYGAGDPRVPPLTFAETQAAMIDALARLPTLLEDEKAGHGVSKRKLTAASAPTLHLALDEEHLSGFAQRLRLSFHGKPTGPDAHASLTAKAPVPLKPLSIDPPSVADDPHYGATLQAQMNIPAAIKAALKSFYP